jgi:ATPase subunit of ABC transporter with duplicated ATPase domains
VKRLAKGYGERPLFQGLSLMVEAGERIAVIGPNGIGKTTLLRCLVGDLQADRGKVKWAEKARLGYFPQDHAADFAADLSLVEWTRQWTREGDDEQVVRGTLGRLLFSGDETKKSVKVISGGEEGRMLFGKLMLQRSNVLLMDEPTNHLDMESIESLNTALEKYEGTLIFVSHDREFVSSLASRVIEMTPQGIRDYGGGYEDYLRSQGIES